MRVFAVFCMTGGSAWISWQSYRAGRRSASFLDYNAGSGVRSATVNTRNSSRQVNSAQQDVHPRLAAVLDVHLHHAWQAPLHGPSVSAFKALNSEICDDTQRLVLDSGCGTGESTRSIARALPDCLVIGVDKSRARLARTGATGFPHREGNALWLRADLATFWRLAARAGWKLRRHYLLYPNPWPKAAQLQRRWHGHPVFPDLLGLGGELEMRSNWEVYATEFAAAVNQVLGTNTAPRRLRETDISTPFERKYRASGHRLYSVAVSCDAGAV
jgi:tRNA G46 methylase TrmB